MMKIGLYFGSFNPIHIGHLIVANYFAEKTDLDQVWVVITPQSPDKVKLNMLSDRQRYQLVELATSQYPKIKPCDIEFGLPQPNYTINTLVKLNEKYSNKSFSLIMGEDNLTTFHKWKNYQAILDYHQLYVYPRISSSKRKQDLSLMDHPKIIRVNAPMIEISSSMVRRFIKDGLNYYPLLPREVANHIEHNLLYK